jgi:two-component system, OmpR family, response regulator CpxR
METIEPSDIVLLVDDEEEYIQALAERLGMRSIKTLVATDGEQALAIAARDRPAVVVLDHRMPGMDGIEVLRRLKRADPGVEVILLTGHGSLRDQARARDLGALVYLQKPVDIDVLLARLSEAKERARRGRGS